MLTQSVLYGIMAFWEVIMKNIKILALLGSLLLSWALFGAQETTYSYGASLESLRLKNDYDPLSGDSDLCVRILFSPEGANPLNLLDARPFSHQCIDIADNELGQFVELPDRDIEAFEKGSGKIRISAVVDEVDILLPRFQNFPMIQSNLYDPEALKWLPFVGISYNQSASVILSNKTVDLKINLYRMPID